MTRKEALQKAYRCFRRERPLPVDLYMELREHGYDPDVLEAQYQRTLEAEEGEDCVEQDTRATHLWEAPLRVYPCR